MEKLNLEQKVFSISGKPMKNMDGTPATLRDYLLIMLGARFDLESTKEAFWTQDLGIKISDSKNKEIEVSEDKMKFLQRLVQKNEVKGVQGQVEHPYTPLEQGQLLPLLGVKEKDIK